MTKKIIRCRVGNPVIRKGHGSYEYIHYMNPRSIYIESSLDSLIEQFNEIKAEYSEFTDLELDAVNDCGCYHDCSCSPTYYVVGNRLETDLEYEFRINKEKADQAAREERERLEYEKLKAKFG